MEFKRNMCRCGILLLVLLSGMGCCGKYHYDHTAPGHMEGTLYLAWVGPDKFMYIPSQEHPLKFFREGDERETIVPGTMYTDGGSIPRFLWWSEQMSPWRFAPSYAIHDWLFVTHRCNARPGNDPKWDVYSTADVLMEGIRAQMESDKCIRNYTTFALIRAGVRSPVAKGIWNKRGVPDECRLVTGGAKKVADRIAASLDHPSPERGVAMMNVKPGAGRQPGAVVRVTAAEWRLLTEGGPPSHPGPDMNSPGLDKLMGANADTQFLLPVLVLTADGK